MSFGLRVYDNSGRLTFEEVGLYGRIIDSFNPFTVGIPSNKTYSYDQYGQVKAHIRQGGGRPLTLKMSGNTVSWAFSDNEHWKEFSGSPLIIITQGG